MASEIKPHFIYGYCLEHKIPMKFIGRNHKNQPIVQCSMCYEKRIVPESWVVGLEPTKELGKTKEDEYKSKEEKKATEVMRKKNGAGRIVRK